MNDALASEVHKALAEFARSTTRNARTTIAFAKKLDRNLELGQKYYVLFEACCQIRDRNTVAAEDLIRSCLPLNNEDWKFIDKTLLSATECRHAGFNQYRIHLRASIEPQNSSFSDSQFHNPYEDVIRPTHFNQLGETGSTGMKHSRFGIASFITSISAAISIALVYAIAVIMQSSGPEEGDSASTVIIIMTLLFYFLIFVDFIALVLGIVGLCSKDKKKIFALLGTIFSSVTIFISIIIIMIDLVANAN